MLLGDEYTELTFFKKYLERSLIQYKLEEAPEKTRGPIVICLDSSGSMRGAPEIWSKAIFLAVASIAKKQKRDLQVIHFGGEVKRIYNFIDGVFDPLKVIECAEYFAHDGGTNFDDPLDVAFTIIKQHKNMKEADILFITDGICEISDVPFFQNLKKEQEISIYTILIAQGGSELYGSDDINKLSNSVTTISDFAQDEEAKEILFSI